MGCKYFIKLFHVLKGVDLNKTIEKINLIRGGGGVKIGSAKSPSLPFFEAFPNPIFFPSFFSIKIFLWPSSL